MLGVAPKRFNSVDMFAATVEFIVAVTNREILIKAQSLQVHRRHAIHLGGPSSWSLVAPNNGLQHSFGGIVDDLSIDAVASFEETKRNGLTACSKISLASNVFWGKVIPISPKFTCKRRVSRSSLRHASADAWVDGVSAEKQQARQYCSMSGQQIKRK